MRHGEPLDGVRHGGGLGAIAFQEFQACRHGREQVPDLDGRAALARGRPHVAYGTRLDDEPERRSLMLMTRCDLEARHGSDRWQRLPPETEGRDGEEILVGELRGGMALDRQREVVGAHAAAVIGNADETAPAGLDDDIDARGAGIERVLDELLDGRGRPLDHLASGDAVDEDRVEATNRHEAKAVTTPPAARRR